MESGSIKKSHKNSEILSPNICLESAYRTTAWLVKTKTYVENGSIRIKIPQRSKILEPSICLESANKSTAWRVKAKNLCGTARMVAYLYDFVGVFLLDDFERHTEQLGQPLVQLPRPVPLLEAHHLGQLGG